MKENETMEAVVESVQLNIAHARADAKVSLEQLLKCEKDGIQVDSDSVIAVLESINTTLEHAQMGFAKLKKRMKTNE